MVQIHGRPAIGEIVDYNKEIPFNERTKEYYLERAEFLIKNNYPVDTLNIEELARKIYKNDLQKEKEKIEKEIAIQHRNSDGL